jgi:L-rhamnose mutarotase
MPVDEGPVRGYPAPKEAAFARTSGIGAVGIGMRCGRQEAQVMIRNAFKMKLLPGHAEEYKKRHDQIWPELTAAIREAGVSDYSIFLDEDTLTLFAVQKLDDDNQVADLPNHPIVKRWWDSMADLMETNPDNSPECIPLREVFHLE